MNVRPIPAVEKLLPQNVEAEAGVLGSILIDPDAIVHVADFLRPDDFYNEAHRTIYQAALELFETHEPADLITLCDELARRGKLDEVGGTSYVSSLANQVPTSRNVKHYAQIVVRTAILRRLINAAGQIAGVAYSEPDAEAALEMAETFIAEVSSRALWRPRTQHGIAAGLLALVDRIEEMQQLRESGQPVGIPTGYRDLDAILGGLRRSDLIILAARPSVGKTSLALSLAHKAALHLGRRVAFYSLEMSAEQLLGRLMAMEARVDGQAVRDGRLSDEQWLAVMEAATRLSDLPLEVDDTPGLTLAGLRARARALMRDWPYDLLVVDYLQLLSANEGGGRENRTQEVSAISRGLKTLARELNVPVLALSQLSRGIETRADKRPVLSDLKESGSLEQDSDVVIFLAPDSERERVVTAIVAKHRNGPLGDAPLYFAAQHTQFHNLDHWHSASKAPTAPAAAARSLPYREEE